MLSSEHDLTLCSIGPIEVEVIAEDLCETGPISILSWAGCRRFWPVLSHTDNAQHILAIRHLWSCLWKMGEPLAIR